MAQPSNTTVRVHRFGSIRPRTGPELERQKLAVERAHAAMEGQQKFGHVEKPRRFRDPHAEGRARVAAGLVTLMVARQLQLAQEIAARPEPEVFEPPAPLRIEEVCVRRVAAHIAIYRDTARG